jgi:hypothetical protein
MSTLAFGLWLVLMMMALLAVIMALTAIQEVARLETENDDRDDRIGKLCGRVYRIQRPMVGLPERPAVAHRDADLYDFPPRPPAPQLIEDLAVLPQSRLATGGIVPDPTIFLVGEMGRERALG